jgi:hypothetical protein
MKKPIICTHEKAHIVNNQRSLLQVENTLRLDGVKPKRIRAPLNAEKIEASQAVKRSRCPSASPMM